MLLENLFCYLIISSLLSQFLKQYVFGNMFEISFQSNINFLHLNLRYGLSDVCLENSC